MQTESKSGRKSPIAACIPAHSDSINASVFDKLPNSAFIRQAQLVANPKRPEHTAPLPFSGPTLWRKVKDKTFPQPIKLSARVTGWNVGEIRQWMRDQAAAAYIPDGKRERKDVVEA